MPGHDAMNQRGDMRAWRNAAYALALGMLLSVVLWWGAPASGLAQSSPQTPTAPILEGSAPIVHQTAASTTPNIWMYLMAMGCALVLGGVYVLRRAHIQQHTRLLAATEEPDALIDTLEMRRDDAIVTGESELQAVAKALARHTSGELGALAVDSELGSPLFALRSEGPQRECPKCRRRFASWMAICPFDNAALKEPGHAGLNVRKIAARRAKANREDMLPRMRCLLCERRFHKDVTYCTHDGEKLIQDMREEAKEAEHWHLCRHCGEDALVGVKDFECGCDEDVRDLITLNPSIMRTRGIPLSKCPTCGVYGGPAQTHCHTHTDEVLLPESVFERHALSAHGHGPERKLCTRCHQRFSGSYSYCPHDAQRLKTID